MGTQEETSFCPGSVWLSLQAIPQLRVKTGVVWPNLYIFSGSQVLLLPCGPGFGHSSADPGAGQTSARPCATAGSSAVTTSAAATPAAKAHAPLPASTSKPTLLPLQASPADPALPSICSCPGGSVPTARRAGARAAAEAHPEAGTERRNAAEPSPLHCWQKSPGQGEKIPYNLLNCGVAVGQHVDCWFVFLAIETGVGKFKSLELSVET